MVSALLSHRIVVLENVRTSQHRGGARLIRQVGSLATMVAAGFVFLHFEAPPEMNTKAVNLADATKAVSVGGDKITWIPYSEETKAKAAQRGQPIFVDFTADWCVSCKAFEKSHIEVQAVRDTFARTGILPVKADLTKKANHLWDVLKTLGRSGIPVYVIYLPDGTHDLFC